MWDYLSRQKIAGCDQVGKAWPELGSAPVTGETTGLAEQPVGTGDKRVLLPPAPEEDEM